MGWGGYFSWGKDDIKNGNWKGFTEEESNSLKNENLGLKIFRTEGKT